MSDPMPRGSSNSSATTTTNGHVSTAPPPPPPPRSSDEHSGPSDLPKVSSLGVVAIVIVLAILFVGLFFAGWIPHQRRLDVAHADATEAVSTKPVVEIIAARESPQDDELLLPGDVQANQSTSIFARTGGYLKPLPPGIDIGAAVQAGQLMAEIAAPEVDAQLEQARASLEQIRAAATRAQEEHSLAATTLKRYEDPSLGRAISQQDLDIKRSQEGVAAAAVKEAQSNIAVADATVKRLSELQGFEKVTAPFSGVITARGYDAGALISSTDAAAGKPLFIVEQVDLLRVQVNVPQGFATDVRPGQTASLLVSNYPGHDFPGAVARSTGSIDPATRTLRVQVDVPNPEGKLLPGMYAQVRFHVRRDRPSIIIPTSALIMGGGGTKVAVLEGDRVRLRTVSIGRDFGADAEILNGLTKDSAIIKNPGSLTDGTEVSRKPTDSPVKG